jgi:hypothetical protein
LLPTLVSDVVPEICESPYGPHSPFCALVEQLEDPVGGGGGAEVGGADVGVG